MDQENNISDQENSNIAEQVMDSMGEPTADSSQQTEQADELPAFAKERLGRQEKRHQRELRELRAQMMQMQNSIGSSQQSQQPMQGGQEDPIQRAVNAALQAQEMKAKQAKDAEKAQHVYKQYQDLESKLDSASDKYDDFDDVVRGNTPYTETMRDTALLLDNPAEVLYKLGKNRELLNRIREMHPIDQAKEMVKLSVALTGGNGRTQQATKPIGQVKNGVVPSPAVTDQTSAADIRARMKSGNWK